MTQYKLYYFPVRARGEPIRMIFALANVAYEEVTVTREKWSEAQLDAPFGKIPVLEVGGVKIPQTIAILRFLADQYGYGGSSAVEKAWVNAVALQCSDFVSDFTPWHKVNIGMVPGDKDALYDSAWKPTRERYFPQFQKLLQKSSSGWFVGDSITFADLMIATCLEMLQTLVPETDKNAFFDGFPELKDHMNKVLTHPQLLKHMQSRPSYKF